METCRLFWRVAIVLGAIFIASSYAKPFSLNEAIKAEAAAANSTKENLNTALTVTSSPKRKPTKYSPEKFQAKEHASGLPKTSELRKRVDSRIFKKKSKPKKVSGTKKHHFKKISPLKFRKLFEIDVPLRPKRQNLLKSKLQQRHHILRNEFKKHDILDAKYIPLLRNLHSLVGNLLSSDESLDTPEQSQHISEKERLDERPCSRKSRKYSGEKTVAAAAYSPAKISNNRPAPATTASQTAHNTALSHLRRLRQDKVVPVLPARDPFSGERDHYGVSSRSRAAFHTSTERDISRHNGDSEYHTGRQRNETGARHDEEAACHPSRDCPGGRGFDRGSRRGGNVTRNIRKTDSKESQIYAEAENATRDAGRDLDATKVENQFETRRIETESGEPLRAESRRLVSKDQVGDRGESVQSIEDSEESFINVTKHITSDQRLTEASSALTGADKEIRPTNETITTRRINNTLDLLIKNSDLKDSKVLLIIDGYSVTRGKFGENKYTEKAIRIH